MKLLIVGDYPDKSGEVIGGVQSAASTLAVALAGQDGVELAVLTCKAGLAKEEVVEQTGFSIHYLPSSTRAGLFTQHLVNRLRLRRKIARIRPDIIHAQNTGFHALAALDSGFPTVLTVHGIFHQEGKFHFAHGRLARVKERLFERLHRRSLERAKHIIAISPYTWAAVGHMSRAMMHPIDNPIDRIYFEQVYDPPSDRLLFVGVIFPYKGIEYLLQAFALLKSKHPSLQLDLIGKVVDEGYYEDLAGYVRENGLSDRVRFIGQRDKHALAREYAASTMLVLPSLQENAPIVISEAMAVGCPVIATRVGGVANMVEHSVSGLLVEPRDADGIASAISALLADSALRQAMSERGRKIALERFSPDAVAAKTMDVYRQVLGGPAAGGMPREAEIGVR